MIEYTCGECVHCDQLTNGLKRFYDVRKRYVEALGHIRCAAWQSIWAKDLFGRTTYSKMKDLKLAK